MAKEKTEPVSEIQTALNKIRETRQTDYGSPEYNFKVIADLWAAYLQVPVSPVDALQMMSLLKKARMKTGKPKLDNVVDDIRYTELAWILARVDI